MSGPRPLNAVGFQLQTCCSGSGKRNGWVVIEQENGGRVWCALDGDDVDYAEDIGRQIMAGAQIEKLHAETERPALMTVDPITVAVAAEREACAVLVEPKGPRPCD